MHAIGDRLEGAWLVVGGAVVTLWLEPRRTTEDVDVMGLGDTADERYRLMDLALELGLPLEAVNSAADFFVRRIEGWEKELEVLHAGKRSVVYRPTATLLVLLKAGRLSARDLEDCRAAIAWARASQARFDVERVRAAIDALTPTEDAGLVARRRELRGLLG